MDGEGIKAAFCILMWRHHGGSLDADLRPVSDQVDSGNTNVRGACSRPYDCQSCAILQQELEHYPREQIHWVCPSCISDVFKRKKAGEDIVVPGYYGDGYCTYPECHRANESDAEGTKSPFLQLVIGRL